MKCQRCFTDTVCTTMSIFNMQTICMDCKKKEEQRPDYQKAVDKENQQVKNGNYNFKGIGY